MLLVGNDEAWYWWDETPNQRPFGGEIDSGWSIIPPPSSMSGSTTMRLLSALHVAVSGQLWGSVSVKSNSRQRLLGGGAGCAKYHVMSFWPLHSLPSGKTRKTAPSFFFSALSYTSLLSILPSFKPLVRLAVENRWLIWFWPKCHSSLYTDKLPDLPVSTEALSHMYCVHSHVLV